MLQALDEQVSSAVLKALKKWHLRIKEERMSNHCRVVQEVSSLPPLGVMNLIKFLTETSVSFHKQYP